MKLPMLPSPVAAQSTAKTGCRSGAKAPGAVVAADSDIGVLLQIVPGHEQETARQPEVLEEGVGGTEARRAGRHLPEAQRHEGGHQREERERHRAQPAPPTGE